MKRKILFTDLDGTLLNDKKVVSPPVKEALLELLRRGHTVVLTSGRPLDSIMQVKEQIGLPDRDVYLNAYNGSLLYDCAGKTRLMECRIPLEEATRINGYAMDRKIYCQCYAETAIVAPWKGAELDYYRRNVHMPYVVWANIMEGITVEPFKMLAIDLEGGGALADLQNWAELSGETEGLRSSDLYLELISSKSGKGTGLSFLCGHLNIPLENSMAIGDAANDITMLQAAGSGVAMFNASRAVKEAADFVTDKNNNRAGLLPSICDFFELPDSYKNGL